MSKYGFVSRKRVGVIVWGLILIPAVLGWADPNDPNTIVVELEHPAIVIASDGSTPVGDVAKGNVLHPDWVDVNTPWDQGWADLLEATGYHVYRNDGTWANGLTPENKALLEAADLVILSRDSGKGTIGNYADDWNPITTPLIALNPWPLGTVNDKKLLRWFPGKEGGHGAPLMVSTDPNIGTIEFIDVNVGSGITSFAWVPGAGNGEVLATIEPNFLDIGGEALGDSAWIIKWDAGVEFFPDVNQYAGDIRVYMAAGAKPDVDAEGYFWGKGMYNLTPVGEQIFLDIVAGIVPPKEEEVEVQPQSFK